MLTLDQRSWETEQQENSFWHNNLVSSYKSRTYHQVSPKPHRDLVSAIKKADKGLAGSLFMTPPAPSKIEGFVVPAFSNISQFAKLLPICTRRLSKSGCL